MKLEIRLFDKHHVRSTWLLLFAPQLPTSERKQGFPWLQSHSPSSSLCPEGRLPTDVHGVPRGAPRSYSPCLCQTRSLQRGGLLWWDLIYVFFSSDFCSTSFAYCVFFFQASASPFFLLFFFFYFFFNSLLSAEDCFLTLKCPSPASLPPTAFFFHPLFLIACAREQRKEKERIPSLYEIDEGERKTADKVVSLAEGG